MTNIQKAIKFAENEIKSLELAPEINGCEMTEEWKEQIEVWETSISALEKQIPKKPIRLGENPLKLICSVSYVCPNCRKHISITPHCSTCGQALEWGDIE